jgi:hypothetical protein
MDVVELAPSAIRYPLSDAEQAVARLIRQLAARQHGARPAAS